MDLLGYVGGDFLVSDEVPIRHRSSLPVINPQNNAVFAEEVLPGQHYPNYFGSEIFQPSRTSTQDVFPHAAFELWEGGIGGGALDPVGIAFALAAGVFWGSYIVMGRRAGDDLGNEAPAFGMIVAALLAIPFGVVGAGAPVFAPHMLGLALIVALLSSAIPYSLEMFALRRLPTRTFGVLTSGEPAVWAVVGALLLHEKLSLAKWLGIAAIVAASISTTMTSRKQANNEAKERELLPEN